MARALLQSDIQSNAEMWSGVNTDENSALI